jgi:hypothetical protein
MDWQISEKDTVNGFFRFSLSNNWFQAAGNTPPNYGNNANFRDKDWAGSITETHTFGPTSINEFRIAYRNYIQARQGQNFDLKPWTLVPALPVQNTGGLPTVTFSGYTGLTDWGAGIDFPTYDVEFRQLHQDLQAAHDQSGHSGDGIQIQRSRIRRPALPFNWAPTTAPLVPLAPGRVARASRAWRLPREMPSRIFCWVI